VHRAALLLAAVLALAACAERPGAGTPDVAGDWELAEGTTAGTALPRPPGAGATLRLDGGEVRGTSFCNHYSGSYRLSGTSLTLDGLGGTEMGCEPDVMAAESAYLTALRSVDTVTVEAEGLLLTGDGVILRFNRVAPVPDRALTGTWWVLDTLVDGETASSTVGDPAVLLLAADGTVQGSTGCRALSGTWTASGDELALAGLEFDGECPADLAGQDVHVVAVLGGGVRAQVEGDRLTLQAPDGRGLGYRVAP
jgi:heat shock protein HslJ